MQVACTWCSVLLLDTDLKDGERLLLAVKDMGSCEIYPQNIRHNPNGRWAEHSLPRPL